MKFKVLEKGMLNFTEPSFCYFGNCGTVGPNPMCRPLSINY